MEYTYKPKGVCCREMQFSIEDGVLMGLTIKGGCEGNRQGISRLVEGMPVEEVIRRLEGILCDGKPTSCPDQLAMALKQVGEV